MKKKIKLFGMQSLWLCAIAVVITFTMAACDDGGGSNGGGGEKWTAVTDNTFGFNPIRAIIYANNTFIAAGGGGKIATSPDGTTWTVVENTTFGTETIYAIAYGNDTFVAGGQSVQLPSNDWTYVKTAISPDGTRWTSVTTTLFSKGLVCQIEDIAWGNNKFVAVGNFGKMAYWDGK